MNKNKPRFCLWPVKTILGFKTLFKVDLPKDGTEICPSPSKNPAK